MTLTAEPANGTLLNAWGLAVASARFVLHDPASEFHLSQLERHIAVICELTPSCDAQLIRATVNTFADQTRAMPPKLTEDDWDAYLRMVQHCREDNRAAALGCRDFLRNRHPRLAINWIDRARIAARLKAIPLEARI